MQTARFIKKEPLTNKVTSFWFMPEKKLDFLPGQYVELTLPHATVDDRGNKRWFSLSSAPEEKTFSITTKLTASQPSSYKSQLMQLSPDDEVLVSAPMGDFVLPIQKAAPIVFVAGGIGVAPMHSMVAHLKNKKESRRIIMYWASREPNMPFQQPFQDFCHSLQQFTGSNRLTGAKIITGLDAETVEAGRFFIAGPEQFVERIKSELSACSIPESRLIADFFHGY